MEKNARATERHSEQTKLIPDAQINIAGGHDKQHDGARPVLKECKASLFSLSPTTTAE